MPLYLCLRPGSCIGFQAAVHSKTLSAKKRTGPSDIRLRSAQVQGQRELRMRPFQARHVETRRVTVRLEPGQAARFRFVAVDREGVIVASARMGNMIDAAAKRPAAPAVENVEGQRSVDGMDRMQGHGRLPGLVAHAGDGDPVGSGFLQSGIMRRLQVTV